MHMQELKGAKMNWKNRLTNYNFWISIFSAVLLILQALKIEFDIAYVNEIFTAVLGLLVVIGIISDPTRTTIKSTEKTNAVLEKSAQAQLTQKPDEKIEIKEPENKEMILPTNKEDEVNHDNNESNLQVILTKITESINEKMNEIAQLNIDTLNKVSETKSNLIEKVVASTEMEKTKPAVAEMINPYLDVIN